MGIGREDDQAYLLYDNVILVTIIYSYVGIVWPPVFLRINYAHQPQTGTSTINYHIDHGPWTWPFLPPQPASLAAMQLTGMREECGDMDRWPKSKPMVIISGAVVLKSTAALDLAIYCYCAALCWIHLVMIGI